jgi:succinoglycan biosynthesis transport protein ExoP
MQSPVMATDTIPASLSARQPHELAVRQPYLLQTAIDRQGEDEDDASALTLSDLLGIVLKHKWTLLLVILVATGIAGVNTFLLRPTYRATAVIQIERAPARVVDFNRSNVDVDQASVDEFLGLKTQYELLRSRSLAERVIDELQLDRSKTPGPGANAAIARAPIDPGKSATPPSGASGNGFVSRLVSGYRKLSTPSTTDPQILGREAVVGAFLGALAVEPIQNSRLVHVSVDNADPALAARIANATVQTFVALGQERRIESSSYAKTFLEDQIKQMKVKLEESERKLNQYAQQKQILSLDEKSNVISQTYMDYAGALGKIEQERIKYETLYEEVKRNPELALHTSEIKSVSHLREQKAALEVEYQQSARIYKPEYPKMLQLKAQIAEVDAQIKAELASLGAVIKAHLEAVRAEEAQLRERLGDTRKQVLVTQDNSIDLNLLKREVDTNRQLYCWRVWVSAYSWACASCSCWNTSTTPSGSPTWSSGCSVFR